jgi:isoleucyl-tRNA synthetase
MSEPLKLKETLNLPKTDFPMKASLPLNEPKQLEAWQEANLYQQILEARQGKTAVHAARWAALSHGHHSPGTGLNKI